MPTYTLTREGRSLTVTSPRELTAAELSHVSSRGFGGAPRLTSGAFDWSRPETYADPAAQAQIKESGRFVTERLVPGILGAATIATGGAAAPLVGVPAAVGRIAGAGLAGGAEAAAHGESIGGTTFLDLAVAGLTEGALAGAVKLKPPKMLGGVPSLADLAEKMRSTKAGLRHATEAPMQAFDMLRARLPKGKWLNVPTLAKAAPRTTREAATRSIEPLRPSPTTPSEAGYHYHATNENNAAEIARSGLKTHKPSYGTDQSVWPDGGVERRSYCTPCAGGAYVFAPAVGGPVLLRVRNDRAAFRGAGSGDTFVREAIPAKHIEIANADGTWRPLQESRAIRGTKELLTVDEAVKRLAGFTAPESRGARAEIASELTRLDVQRVTGPKPLAGAIFKTFTEPERFLYRGTPLERVAERVVGATRHPITRTAADVAATADVGGLPAGAWPAMLGAQQASSVAERVMGR